MNYEFIETLITDDKIGIITLNRPEKSNALSMRLREEISYCLADWRNNDKIQLLILTGAGTTFSAGFYLQEFSQPERMNDIFQSSSKYHRDVWNFQKPTVAAINGAALGVGFDLTTLCDIRISSEASIFGHPEIKFGACPLYTPLRWIVGSGIARELCLTGRRINAEEAHRIGLVSEIVSGSILDRAIEIGKTILKAPADTLTTTKRYMVKSSDLGFEESFRIEHDEPFQEALGLLKTSVLTC